MEEVFRKEELVFLTPDADEVLNVVDASKVYVIGGLVDRTTRKVRETAAAWVAAARVAGSVCGALTDWHPRTTTQHISSSRATDLGISMKRLPLQEHLPVLLKPVMNVNTVFEMLLKWQVRCVPMRVCSCCSQLAGSHTCLIAVRHSLHLPFQECKDWATVVRECVPQRFQDTRQEFKARKRQRMANFAKRWDPPADKSADAAADAPPSSS